jgi:type II secretory ATPase GspE/PulE/Tfp pilus assembly ATPase PilB-like protein
MLRNLPVDVHNDEPVAVSVNALMGRAIEAKASDLHIAPMPDGGSVRMRVDGILRDAGRLSRDGLLRVVSRIKLLAGMDIADRRLPQDGRYDIEYRGRSIDLRVSSLPTIDGERLSIRLLDRSDAGKRLDELGMSSATVAAFRQMLRASSGFVVICGPTGSGKTTTLYAAVRERDLHAEHICSVEDPVELRVAGVAQVQINVRSGLTFGSVLRAILRQDPDVLVIGEMRDSETAQIAATAALCGRLVLTTLHTANALTAFERLRELGVGTRTMASAVTAVVAQELRKDASATNGVRTASFELLRVCEEFRRALQAESSAQMLAAIAIRGGYLPIGGRAA